LIVAIILLHLVVNTDFVDYFDIMDTFDVDLFAKYLLNDNIGETNGGAPFDFR
jgi:hypothetical protein